MGNETVPTEDRVFTTETHKRVCRSCWYKFCEKCLPTSFCSVKNVTMIDGDKHRVCRECYEAIKNTNDSYNATIRQLTKNATKQVTAETKDWWKDYYADSLIAVNKQDLIT